MFPFVEEGRCLMKSLFPLLNDDYVLESESQEYIIIESTAFTYD